MYDKIHQENNSIVIHGDNHAPIASGYQNQVFSSDRQPVNCIDWQAFQRDLDKLRGAIDDYFDEGEKKQAMRQTIGELQIAANQCEETGVKTALKRASQSTIRFIRDFSLELIPVLIEHYLL